ncbi:MAG: T9SS type A sorting domain-containing protein [bacterium]
MSIRGGITALLAVALAVAPNVHADGWQQLPLGDESDVRVVAVSSQHPYYALAASDVLYRSSDSGGTWSVVPAAYSPLRHLRFHGSNDDVFATCDGRVLVSTDLGSTWDPWGASTPGGEIQALALSGETEAWVATATDAGALVYRTTDSGGTWQFRGAEIQAPIVYEFARDPNDATRIAIATSTGIELTTNGGQSWVEALAGESLQVNWHAAGMLRAIHGPEFSRVLIESTDIGATWETLFDPPLYDGVERFAADPADADFLLAARSRALLGGCYGRWYGELVRSTDGGATWGGVLTTDNYRYSIAAYKYPVRTMSDLGFAAGSAWFVISGWPSAENLFLSSGLGAPGTWSPSQLGMHESRSGTPYGRAFLEVDAGGALYTCRPSKHWRPWSSSRSTDAGQTWDEAIDLAQDAYLGSFQVSKLHSGRQMRVSGWALSHNDCNWVDWGIEVHGSTDGGVTWQYWNHSIGGPYSPKAWADHGTYDSVFIVNGQTLWRSTDAGASFAPVAAVGGLFDLVVSPESDERLCAIFRDEPIVRASSDGGHTWAPRSNGLPSDAPTQLLMDPHDGATLLVIFPHRAPWMSTNGGESWRPVGDRGPDRGPTASPWTELLPPGADLHGVTVLCGDWEVTESGARVFLGTERGVWDSDQGLVGPGPFPVREVEYLPSAGVLVALTDAGVFSLPVDRRADGIPSPAGPLPTSTPVDGVRLTIAPNPFDHATTIELEGARENWPYRLGVFDVVGRRVRTLSGTASTTRVGITWDGRDASGRVSAPGVYFVRLESDDTSRATRVVKIE